jgi:hypothetical protein
MKNNSLALIIILIIFCFSACSSKKSENEEISQPENFKKGEIIPKVECLKDKSQSYALYLPSNYDPKMKYPIIYFFDPKARGSLPVKLFRELAEKYGYILVGSYNSMNGISWSATNLIVNILFDDTYKRFSIDRGRVYTCGFSGGARVAASIALYLGGINAVIGCSAGLPEMNEPPQYPFHYLTMVGSRDFNYLEMTGLDKKLENSELKHHLIIFDGKHDWPPKTELEDAVLWLEFSAMKDSKKTKDITLVQEFINRNENILDSLLKTSNIWKILDVYKKVIDFTDGLADISKYKAKYMELLKSSQYLQLKNLIEKCDNDEAKYRNEYIQALQNRDLNWWKSDINRINSEIKNAKQTEIASYNKRLLAFLSLVSYMSAVNALDGNSIEKAELFTELYELVDAENPDLHYLKARLLLRNNEFNKALDELDSAVVNGFDEVSKLESDKILSPLKSLDRYKELIWRIK